MQDRAQPETQARSFGGVMFNAFLAVDDPGALVLVRQPGSDGFRMDSAALFQVSTQSRNKSKIKSKVALEKVFFSELKNDIDMYF